MTHLKRQQSENTKFEPDPTAQTVEKEKFANVYIDCNNPPDEIKDYCSKKLKEQKETP